MSDLEKEIKAHEGYRSTVYGCTEGYETIGYGFAIKDLYLTEEVCDIILKQKIAELELRIHQKFDWFKKSPEEVKNVVLNMWWKHPAQAVDTHIFRVGNRTGIAPGKDVDAVERAIEDNVPADFQLHAHHWLILHGRYHCKARKPLCSTCLIRDLCSFEDKEL